jgi:hypothetical protein
MLVVHLVRINCALPSTSTGSQLILILDCLNWVYAFLCFILFPVPRVPRTPRVPAVLLSRRHEP